MGDFACDDELFQVLAREAPVAVIDLEMTGLSPKVDRICEVAVIRGRDGVVDDEFHTLVKPAAPMSEGALAVHGLTPEILADAPTFPEVAARVSEVLGDSAVVAHNVPFDMTFLQRELEESGHGFTPAPITVDTLLMARRLFAFRRNNLGDVARALGIPLDNAHRALHDARATFHVYARMLEILDPDKTVTLRELNDLVDALAPNSTLRLRQRKTLRRAFRDRKTVWIDYQSTSDPAEGTVRRQVGIWHLKLPRVQGWCHLRTAERIFRLDRMTQVTPGEEAVEIPEDFERRI